MQNDLAWAVLGVDPAVRKNIERLAAQHAISLGRCLEMMLNEVTDRTKRAAKERKQLRALMTEMADSDRSEIFAQCL